MIHQAEAIEARKIPIMSTAIFCHGSSFVSIMNALLKFACSLGRLPYIVVVISFMQLSQTFCRK